MASVQAEATALVTPVIMCGGAGTRLWPLSTATRPKPLHALSTELTLLQETALRGSGDADRKSVGGPGSGDVAEMVADKHLGTEFLQCGSFTGAPQVADHGRDLDTELIQVRDRVGGEFRRDHHGTGATVGPVGARRRRTQNRASVGVECRRADTRP